MSTKGRILIIEDEAATRCLCENLLRREGYKVEAAADGAAGMAAMLRSPFDLVLLDLNLPDIDGLELTGKLRSLQPAPILMMTARGEPEERVAGFEAGAMDYLVKPFHLSELKHRIHNALGYTRPEAASSCRHSFGCWVLDLDHRSLESRNGRHRIELTRGEFDLLAILVAARGRVLNRGFLLDAVVRAGGEGHPRTVDVLVSRLRKKIEENSSRPHYILTVKGIGYRLGPLS